MHFGSCGYICKLNARVPTDVTQAREGMATNLLTYSVLRHIQRSGRNTNLAAGPALGCSLPSSGCRPDRHDAFPQHRARPILPTETKMFQENHLHQPRCDRNLRDGSCADRAQ